MNFKRKKKHKRKVQKRKEFKSGKAGTWGIGGFFINAVRQMQEKIDIKDL